MNCTTCQSGLPELLLDSGASTNAELRAHLVSCTACATELTSLEATFALLDDWKVPEVSPYFDQKLAVRLREEFEAPPAGWLERIKTYLLLSTGRQFRPALAGGLAVALLIGGGTLGISTFQPHQAIQASATVNDLQILDKNEQALQQMDQLLLDNAADDSSTATPPQS